MQKQQETPTNMLENSKVLGPVATIFDSIHTGSWRLERPKVNFEACIKCGICEKNCPPNIITVHKDRVESVEIDWYYCKGCGICANECPKKCIAMVDERGEL